MKGRKGISMIALVITIIILLILAGVTLSILTGDNGILLKTNKAKQQTQKEEAKEQAKIDITAWIADKMHKEESVELNDTIIKDILTNQEYVKEAKETSFIAKNGEVEITYAELYQSLNSGETEDVPDQSGEGTKVTPQDIVNCADKSEYYGAAVTGYSAGGISNWRIFHADENNIYLVTDDYISSSQAPKGRKGASVNVKSTDYKFTFADIAKEYNGYADLKNAGMDNITAGKWAFQDLLADKVENIESAKQIAYLLDLKAWSIFADEEWAEYAMGAPTLPLYIASCNACSPEYGFRITFTNGKYRFIAAGGGVSHGGAGANASYKNPAGIYVKPELYKAESTYIASATCYTYGKNNLFVRESDYDFWISSESGLRPIVVLKSDVGIKKIGNHAVQLIH